MARFKVKSFRAAGYDTVDQTADIAITPGPGPMALQIYEDTVVGAYVMTVYGSIDGVNFTQIGSTVTAETILEILAPINYIRVYMTSAPGTSGTVYAKICWVWGD